LNLKNLFLSAVLFISVTIHRGYLYSQEILLPPEINIYAGAFPNLGGTEDDVTAEKLEKFSTLTGRIPAWVYFSNNWFNGIKFPVKEVKLIYESGSIPYIRMVPRSSFNTGKQDSLYNLDKIISGQFDIELRKWASDAMKTAKPVLAEFAPEVNGNWFPWSGINLGGGVKDKFGSNEEEDGPGKFKAAYRHIINISREEGAFNITWVYHPNGISAPQESWNTLKSYYPGDDYIDWIGVSVYGSQKPGWKWTKFTDVFDGIYEELCGVSEVKPLAIIEFGVAEDSASGSKAEWFEDAFNSFASGRYPKIKAISYWHSSWQNEDGTTSNLKIDSSPAALEVYKKYINGEYFNAVPVFSQ